MNKKIDYLIIEKVFNYTFSTKEKSTAHLIFPEQNDDDYEVFRTIKKLSIKVLGDYSGENHFTISNK